MKDATWLRLSALAVGLVLIETALVLGVDGTAMLLGGAALGVGLGLGATRFSAARVKREAGHGGGEER